MSSMSIRAICTMTIEFEINSAWDGKTSLEHTYDDVRRSAVSIPSNIAEGYGRHATNDYIRFLRIASGSTYELQTQSELAKNLNYVQDREFQMIDGEAESIARMLSALIRKLGGKNRQ